ncbi:hypothetical protein NYR61_02320 [Actinobacillus genomosp. 1]|uniref:hypothetical protein n=1 Tax=Actinobacillus genomosp. 1 TaxID=254839 RepID=UPI0024416D32|nr:hypothetical protein [Actinobacillus genomosp. 1]WGE34411.1 hypothetical protein NYR61_02320 [Actinobacillus genomosp. 1]
MNANITRKEKLGSYLLASRNGFSELDGMRELGITSGRNEINELEAITQTEFIRIQEHNQNGGTHFRYFLADKTQAERLITFLNGKAVSRNAAIPYPPTVAESVLNQLATPTQAQLQHKVRKPVKGV